MENMYRLFLKTDTQKMHYKLGYIIDMYDFSIEEANARLDNKSKVFIAKGAAKYISAEATY